MLTTQSLIPSPLSPFLRPAPSESDLPGWFPIEPNCFPCEQIVAAPAEEDDEEDEDDPEEEEDDLDEEEEEEDGDEYEDDV